MPQYIKKAPWYVSKDAGKDAEVLQHQRRLQQTSEGGMYTNLVERGLSNTVVTKYRKGSCTNCGVMTHDAKSCIERPRKLGAKYSGQNFGRDEVIAEQKLGYAAKRDRWNNYDPREYQEVIQNYEVIEGVKKHQRETEKEENVRKREQKMAEKQRQREAGAQVSDDSSDSDSQDSDLDQGDQDNPDFVNRDPKVRTAVRNLRQREDVAKYLRNLDPNSARYDPKSRTLKDNPNPDLPESNQQFKGDNWVKYTGDAPQIMKMEGFMIEANKIIGQQEGAAELNTVGLPTQMEILNKAHIERKQTLQDTNLKKLLDQYGGRKHLNVPEVIKHVETNYDNTVNYVRPANGLTGVKTKYLEDVYPGKHTSIWGSFYEIKTSRWGFRCCYSFDHSQDLCAGERGRVAYTTAQEQAKTAQEQAMLAQEQAMAAQEQESAQEQKELNSFVNQFS